MLAVIVLVLIFFYYLLFHNSMQGNRKIGARSFKNWGWHEFPTVNNICPQFWGMLIHLARFQQLQYVCVCVYVYRKGVLNYILQHLFITFYPWYILILSPVLSESNRKVVIWTYLNVHKITRLQINYFLISYFIPL